MSKFLRKPSQAPQFGQILAEVVREAPDAPRAASPQPGDAAEPWDKVMMAVVCCASVSFCIYALLTSVNDPNYFSRKLISSLRIDRNLDPIMTGTVAKPEEGGQSLPVPVVVRKKDPAPSDYQIVMVYEGEAILATNDELMRAKVGTVLPGLGAIKEIVPSSSGGMVVAEDATLKTATP